MCWVAWFFFFFLVGGWRGRERVACFFILDLAVWLQCICVRGLCIGVGDNLCSQQGQMRNVFLFIFVNV